MVASNIICSKNQKLKETKHSFVNDDDEGGAFRKQTKTVLKLTVLS
jgi:hypothetical protein